MRRAADDDDGEERLLGPCPTACPVQEKHVVLERAQCTRNKHVLVVSRRLLLDEVREGLARLGEVRRAQDLHLVGGAKADDAVQSALVRPETLCGFPDGLAILLGRVAWKGERDLGVG